MCISNPFSDPTKPVVKLNPPGNEITVKGGEQHVKVVCQNAGGDPRPKKEWRDPTGKVIHSCDKHSDTCTLRIKNPTYEKHHGKYTCVASNSGGETKVEVMINILCEFSYRISQCSVIYYSDLDDEMYFR